MPDSALIGHSGFVGSTLCRERTFGALFNSATIAGIRGRHFDRVVCAGARAVKWWSNQNPDEDRRQVQALIDDLRHVTAERFMLISTIDVYRNPSAVDEGVEPDFEDLHPYGRHRLELERFVRAHFPPALVVRLPGLFGEGLKKNILFDLVHGHQVDRISPEGVFQWYPMDRLARDLDILAGSGLGVVNIAPEPVKTADILERFFPDAEVGHGRPGGAPYDMWTRHAGLLGGEGHYHMTRAQVLDRLEDYLGKARAGRA